MGEVGRGCVRSLELGLVKSGVPQQASGAGEQLEKEDGGRRAQGWGSGGG